MHLTAKLLIWSNEASFYVKFLTEGIRPKLNRISTIHCTLANFKEHKRSLAYFCISVFGYILHDATTVMRDI